VAQAHLGHAHASDRVATNSPATRHVWAVSSPLTLRWPPTPSLSYAVSPLMPDLSPTSFSPIEQKCRCSCSLKLPSSVSAAPSCPVPIKGSYHPISLTLFHLSKVGPERAAANAAIAQGAPSPSRYSPLWSNISLSPPPLVAGSCQSRRRPP
jgi:hypothetical protein